MIVLLSFSSSSPIVVWVSCLFFLLVFLSFLLVFLAPTCRFLARFVILTKIDGGILQPARLILGPVSAFMESPREESGEISLKRCELLHAGRRHNRVIDQPHNPCSVVTDIAPTTTGYEACKTWREDKKWSTPDSERLSVDPVL